MICNRGVALGLLVALASAIVPGRAAAQHYQSDFPPDEFEARWARVFDRIGADAVAVLQGVSLTNGYTVPRQHNTFYYLCGIETAGAYLLLDGRTRQVTLYLPPPNAQLERAEGKVLSAADGALVQTLTGVDRVLDASTMGERWPTSAVPSPPTRIFAEFEPAEGQGQSRGELRMGNAAVAGDPWDGRPSREARFVERLRARNPAAEVRNFSPILDELRAIKSPREIALIRRASQLAGLGLIEAMRSTEAGAYEYQLDAAARYVFLVNGARLEAYRSITASGTGNIDNMHYYRNTRRLEDGDLVLMDYAPDYRYYVSDVGRVWPVSGTYAPWQRELLQFTLDYHKAVLARIEPGATPKQILDDARQAMEPIVAATKWSKPIYEAAARRLIETGGGALSHMVGMAVHDVGSYRDGLKPGHVFSVDPQLRVPEEHLFLRFEDTIAVTETGHENFTAFMPVELDAMEAAVREKGLVQTVPAESAAAPARSGTAPLRILVVTGGHDYPTSFYTLFEQPGLTWDHETTSEAAYRRDLRHRYDVLVLYDMPATLSAAGRANLQAFAESGKGIVVMHHALCSHNDWDWYRDLVGGRYQVEAAPGRPASSYKHDETMPVAIARPHPITDGLTLKEIHDETYKGMWLSPDNTVLLTTTHPLADPPLAWVSPYPKSRVVAIQPGHGREAHVLGDYRTLVRNAILWSAGRLQ